MRNPSTIWFAKIISVKIGSINPDGSWRIHHLYSLAHGCITCLTYANKTLDNKWHLIKMNTFERRRRRRFISSIYEIQRSINLFKCLWINHDPNVFFILPKILDPWSEEGPQCWKMSFLLVHFLILIFRLMEIQNETLSINE